MKGRSIMHSTGSESTPLWTSRTLASSGLRGLKLLALAGFLVVAVTSQAFAKRPAASFDLVPSAGAIACLPEAQGEVRLTSQRDNQRMDVRVKGLPAFTAFTVFLLQVPHGPFGLSWYQGDIETDSRGNGHATFLGIFSDETFIVAPGVAAAPVLHSADAATNPQTAPVHVFHLGMWFESPADAAEAGCAGTQTPFNGDHTAGIQVLNTTNFPDEDGPIGQFTP